MELRWADQAEADLYEIASFYADVSSDFAELLLDRVLDTPLILLDHPNLGRRVGSRGFRKWLVRRTPFLLLYRIIGHVVEVARVVHAGSDWEKSL